MIDQVEALRDEARGPHALFHQFALTQARSAENAYFLFFEGVDDPAFFGGYVAPLLGGREYHEYICNGRDGVLKAQELCARDGRARDRTLFFVDKDHTDIMGGAAGLPEIVFQTEYYSFENYLVCKSVFRRFWVERLRLSIADARYQEYLELFERLHSSFNHRMRILMAIIIIGRGIGGRASARLNLNNVDLAKVINIDISAGRVRWAQSGGQHFLAASNIKESGIQIRGSDVRRVYRTYLLNEMPKSYIRGKYELWFFVHFLAVVSRKLSDRIVAKASGLPRATPGQIIHYGICLDSLPALLVCPVSLASYLCRRIPPQQGNSNAH